MKISEILTAATDVLQASGIEQPRREANSLLAFALRKNRAFLIAHSEDELSRDEEHLFQSLIERRARREPFQYIVGGQEFFGLRFAVSPDVLIPRPETEIVVEQAIEILGETARPRFCEVGVGSGCISVAILHALADASAIGVDISEAALQLARRNAETHDVAERFELLTSDVFDNLPNEKFNLIVSNPPYISADEMIVLQPEVGSFEPRTALTDGGDGFAIIEKIAVNAPRFLKPKGFLLMEIGFGQAEKVLKMFDRKVWQTCEILPDLQGIGRTAKARIF